MYKGRFTCGYSNSMGYYVQIKSLPDEHGLQFEENTIYIWYGHLSSYENNLNGTIVEQGALIGYTGNSGSIASKIGEWQYHLHLTIYKGSLLKYNRTNPTKYLNTKFDSNGNKIE